MIESERPESPRDRAVLDLHEYLRDDKAHERLRPAQRTVMGDVLRFFERHTKGYIELPTGCGKTVLFTEIIKTTDLHTLIVVPTKQLVAQTVEALAANGINDVRIVSVTTPERINKRVSIATYASLVKNFRSGSGRFTLDPSRYELVILDEAHHSPADGASQALEQFSNAFQIGFTATPDYSETHQLRNVLPNVIHRLSIKEAAEMGLISPFSSPVLFTNTDLSEVSVTPTGDYDAGELDQAINTVLRNNAVARFYAETFPDKKAVFSCSGVEHALNLAEVLRAQGINAEAVYGQMPRKEQEEILELFAKGSIQALTNNKLLAEGFDVPSVEIAINVSPTLSHVRQQQRSGRTLRIDPANPDKHALVIDCLDVNYQQPPVLFCNERIAGTNHFSGPNGLSKSASAVLEKVGSYAHDGTFLELNPTDIIQALLSRTKPSKTRKQPPSPPRKHGTEDSYLPGIKLDFSTDGAICSQTSPDDFFPERGSSTTMAKIICGRCVLIDECRDWAVESGERFGVWGGLSERERRKLKQMQDSGRDQEEIQKYLDVIYRRTAGTKPMKHTGVLGLLGLSKEIALA